jgi:hypothetical protein
VIFVLLALAVIVVVLAGAFVTFFVRRGGVASRAATKRSSDAAT